MLLTDVARGSAFYDGLDLGLDVEPFKVVVEHDSHQLAQGHQVVQYYHLFLPLFPLSSLHAPVHLSYAASQLLLYCR